MIYHRPIALSLRTSYFVTMKELIIQQNKFNNALLLAPMAGVTHSAFRRLIADFGGYDILFTEMLAPRGIFYTGVDKSPYTIIRPQEGKVVYQLMLNSKKDLDDVINRLKPQNPYGFDLNLGCPAPAIRKKMSGARLFQDAETVDTILGTLREYWEGPLSIKCRLGEKRGEVWQPHFEKMVHIFEKHKIDFMTLHPRFRTDRLRRPVLHSSYQTVTEMTDIPLIANGDILTPSQIDEKYDHCSGLMLGRITAVQPWIFAEFTTGQRPKVDTAEVWFRFFRYVLDDFNDAQAIGRMKQFTTYFAQNFLFGHTFYGKVQGAKSLTAIEQFAKEFFAKDPQLKKSISAVMEQ